MVAVVWFLPFLFALGLVAPLVVAQFHPETDAFLTRIAVTVFGQYVAEESDRKRDQQQRMRAAHVGDTHRSYASRTLLFAAVLGVFGSILGVYVIGGVLIALEIGGEVVADALPPALSFVGDFDTVSDMGVVQLFPLLLLSSATFGAGLSGGVYYLRWLLLDQRAYARAGKIEATLPRTVAFIYALSRSGMAFPKVMNTLAENEDVYGEAARELGVAVREMETLGADPLTAMDRLSERTPADNMSEFAGNLSSVLGSGRNLSEFLRNQYRRFQDEAESQQEQYLEILSTMAEAYVTVLVAGPLFLITILVVIGLVLGQNTMFILRFIVYAGIPLATFGFAVYVDSVSQGNSGGEADAGEYTDPRSFLADSFVETDDQRRDRETELAETGSVRVTPEATTGRPNAQHTSREATADGGRPPNGDRETDVGDSTTDDGWFGSSGGTGPSASSVTDALPSGSSVSSVTDSLSSVFGGSDEKSEARTEAQSDPDGDRLRASRQRLAAYDAVESYLQWFRRPGQVLRERPGTTGYFTIPLGLVWIVLRTGALPLSPVPAARAVDSPLIEATLFVLFGYTAIYEYERRRTKGVESAVPDFLDRMASVNDAGMSVVESVETLARDDVGALTTELQRTWRDIQWGADLVTALHRLKDRVDSVMVTRAVSLTSNAVAASGDVAPVMEIAADEARSTQQLRRERRQVMLTYMIVIYVSFFVFLAIVGALTTQFLPAIESAELGGSLPGGGSVPGVGGGAGGLSGIQNVEPAKYVLLFYHASAIQGVASGVIAGQLGEGDVRDGAKHVLFMLFVSFVVFHFFVGA